MGCVNQYIVPQSFSDYWKSYATIKAKTNHPQVGKESGQTNPIERYWATLRARITRYVRKAIHSLEN